jgi:hypothetical protein
VKPPGLTRAERDERNDLRRARYLIAQCGPYKVSSLANGDMKVAMLTPDWPQFPKYNEHDGGGPGLFSRLALASELETYLNRLARRKAKGGGAR